MRQRTGSASAAKPLVGARPRGSARPGHDPGLGHPDQSKLILIPGASEQPVNGGGQPGASESRSAGDRRGDRPVPDPSPPLLASEQARVVQDGEVVADRRLGAVQRPDELAGARLTLTGRDHAQEAEPHRVREDLERRGELAPSPLR